MNPARLAIPPMAPEDRLPDDRAVWRDPPVPAATPRHVRITVEYPGGMRERTTAADAAGFVICSWRFGWAPERRAAA